MALEGVLKKSALLVVFISTLLQNKHLATAQQPGGQQNAPERHLHHQKHQAHTTHHTAKHHATKHHKLLQELELQQQAPKQTPTFSSVVINPNDPHALSFIRVLNPPFYFHNNHRAHIEYSCHDNDLLAIEIFLQSDDVSATPVLLFHHEWTCNKYSRGTRQTFVHLTVPDWLVYRPDYLQRHAVNVQRLELKAWIINDEVKHTCSRWNNCHGKAYVQAIHRMGMQEVYQRPRKDHEAWECLSWVTKMMLEHGREGEFLRCQVEEELISLVDFPVAFAGVHSGITKDLIPFRDQGLLVQQQINRLKPKFTLSTTIFLLEYCSVGLCGIYHRKTHHSNQYITPLILINSKGLIHIQTVLEDDQASGILTSTPVPLRQWVKLVYTQNGSKWSMSISSGKNMSKTHISNSNFKKPLQYDETEGLMHLGGSSASMAFKGFIADTWLWRTKAAKQVPVQSSSTPELMEKISNHYSTCDAFHKMLSGVYKLYLNRQSSLIAKKTCSNSFSTLLSLPTQSPVDTTNLCPPWEQPPPRGQRYLWTALRKASLHYRTYEKSFDIIGRILHDKATEHLADGLTKISSIVAILRKASCYGNHQSSYMLGTLYDGGVNVAQDQNEAYKYWLVAAQEGNRLAMMALANHHSFGLKAAPNDFDFSYNYLKYLASLTLKDRQRHDPDAVMTEFVRLTDTESLRVHKGESSDQFLWLKYQAKKGIAQAQLDLARVLFWGQMGVGRDVQQALDLYQVYLRDNPLDEVAQYDMGIIQLKGQGTDKNINKALEHLNKSAELGHAPAYTAIGWYALNFQDNTVKAAKMFDIADRRGHRDASHNLGYMYKTGRYPGKQADQEMAFKYFQRAANKGHIDSAGVIGDIYNQGTKNMSRNSQQAASWSRLVGEQNPEIGMALRKGLDAYLSGSWGESIVYYMMVAETGLEVAQFNVAHLCEEDYDGVVSSFIRADCKWRYYNMSSHSRTPHIVSQLKMGDYFYYGYNGEADNDTAVMFYTMAAKKNDPQALFNLASLVEEGITIDESVLRSLRIPSALSSDTNGLIKILYRRCRDRGKDSYIPCSLALLRVQLMELWGKHTLAVQLSGALMLCLLTLYSITIALQHTRWYCDPTQGQSSQD
ncbi:protein sel-1 homolog 3-like isoform X1 [Asterias amurensis]|uniref:protein sel-1 homolog 3-like isoform X1 n=1 Tax=Asterias amurensis TaxID=7602 RepID=UPI003AB14F05